MRREGGEMDPVREEVTTGGEYMYWFMAMQSSEPHPENFARAPREFRTSTPESARVLEQEWEDFVEQQRKLGYEIRAEQQDGSLLEYVIGVYMVQGRIPYVAAKKRMSQVLQQEVATMKIGWITPK